MPSVSHPDASRSPGTRPGVSAIAARYRAEALAELAREPLSAPVFEYRIHPATIAGSGVLRVGTATLEAPGLAAEPGELVAVAAAACTLGAALQERIAQLFAARRRSLAVALDALANERLFRLADQAAAAIGREARRRTLDTGLEISPGDAGLPLSQQAAVLALAGSGTHGISVTGGRMLAPVYSLSLLVALGRNLRKRSAAARCDACPSRVRCAMN